MKTIITHYRQDIGHNTISAIISIRQSYRLYSDHIIAMSNLIWYAYIYIHNTHKKTTVIDNNDYNIKTIF